MRTSRGDFGHPAIAGPFHMRGRVARVLPNADCLDTAVRDPHNRLQNASRSKHAITPSDTLLQAKRREHRFVFQAQTDLQIGADLPDTLDQMPANVFACGTTEAKPPII